MNDLLTVIDLQSPDILCITETKPKNCRDFTPHELDSMGYMSHHSTEGRGVSVYVKNNWVAEEINLASDFVESVWVRLKCDKLKVLIGTVYRSPNSSDANNQALLRLMDDASKINHSVFICVGDFNFKEIDWRTNRVHCTPTHPASLMYDKLNDLFLKQVVTEPTRYREGETQNLLDWVLTNNPDRIENLQCGPPLGEKGDHCTILFKIVVKYSHKDKGGNYCFNKGDYHRIKENLCRIDWDAEIGSDNIEIAWLKFQSIMNKTIEQFIPKFKPRDKLSPQWMDSEIRMSIKERNKAWNVYKKNKNVANWENFKSRRNYVGRLVNKKKADFENQLATNIKGNPKLFWNYVRFSTGGKKEIPAIKDENGKLVTEDMEKVELFNKYFCDVYTVEDITNVPQPNRINVENSLSLCPLSPDIIEKQLGKLNTSKAAGPDNIHARVLSETKDIIKTPLYKIFSKSLEEKRLPSNWKEAYIKPLHKKGSRHDPSNYRPVSLTSVCGKTCERIIRNSLMEFLEEKKLISPHQHGFRSGRSCCTQLLEIMEIWTKILDDGGSWDCIYLDFAKAFDRVPHLRLISKLESIGISGNLLGWITDFLSNRKQSVVLNGARSSQRDVTSGIPQGSVLGPILFIIFINDMPNVIDSEIKIFADDTKLFRAITSIEDNEKLQEDLNALNEWSRKWQLGFNTSKCKTLHYGTNNKQFTYLLDGDTIENSTLEKDLGVTFDLKLKFSEHVGIITRKANSRLAIIKRTMHNLTPNIFLPLYKTLVRPILEYCSAVWNPMLMKDRIEIEKVQRRATKLIPSLCNLEYSERLYRLNLDSLHFRRRRSDIIQVFKIVKGFDNVKCDNFFKVNADNRTRGHSLKLVKVSNNCNTRLNSFSQRIINDWNSLEEATIQCKTINSFKSALKKEWSNHPDRYDMP